MQLWTIQPREVWEALQEAGTLIVDSKHSDCFPDFGQEFRSSYDWLVGQMTERIPGYSGNYPWWAWVKPPDMRREIWNLSKGEPFCLMELSIPDEKVCLSDFIFWHYVLSEWYCYWTIEEEEAWDNEWQERLGKHWSEKRMDKVTRQEYRKRLEDSWKRIFEGDSPDRQASVWQELVLQATFEPLNLSDVISVKHYVGRMNRSK